MATLVALLMLLPLTPAAFYLMTFWKDSWTAILFLWVAAFGLRLYDRCAAMTPAAFLLQFAGLAALMVVTGITRYNALVALPIMGAMLWLILARRGVRFGWLLIALPAASLFASAAIGRIYAVTRYHPEDHVKILELVGLCIAYPDCRAEFPYINENLRPGNESSFRFGNICSLSDAAAPVVNLDLLMYPRSAILGAEYRHAVLAHPLRLLRVKWRGFCRLFDPANAKNGYCQKELDPNPYGLHQNRRFATTRKWLLNVLYSAFETPFFGWIACQNVWFSLNLALVAGLLIHFLRRRTRLAAFRLLVMSIPLSYALSYLAAITGFDYRFLYPATLFMQVAALSTAIFCVWWYFSKPCDGVSG